jgi:catalase
VSKLTKAKFLSQVGKETPVFVRFSTVTYGREYPDSARNPRGFAIKFYTEDGNYDLVGLNFPVFFARDPMLGPDIIKSQSKNPQKFTVDYDAMFDFMSLVPESVQASTMMFSDYGTPRGWRFMHGYGGHTFKWVNAAGEEVYIKYHFICEQGSRNFTWDEAKQTSGEDPDFSKRDLYDHIQQGKATAEKCVVQT